MCSWKKSRTRAYPAPLKAINFKRPQQGALPDIDNQFTGTLSGFTSPDPLKFVVEADKQDLLDLKNIASTAAVFSSVSLWMKDENDSDTDTADETDLNTLPELMNQFLNQLQLIFPSKNF